LALERWNNLGKPLVPKKIKHTRAGFEDRLIENNPEIYLQLPTVVDHVWSEDADLLKWYHENVYKY